MLRRRVRLSTICLSTLAMFDLVTTLMLLNRGLGEGNPLFAWLLGWGVVPFIVGKLAFTVGPILILEFARKYRPQSAEVGTWIAFVAYLWLYVGHVRDLSGG